MDRKQRGICYKKHLESGEEKLTNKAEVEQYVREQQNKALWVQEIIC